MIWELCWFVPLRGKGCTAKKRQCPDIRFPRTGITEIGKMCQSIWFNLIQWRIQGRGRGARPPYFQTKLKHFETASPPLFKCHGWTPPPALMSRSGSSTVLHQYIIRKNFSNKVITWECVLSFAPYMKAFLLKDHQPLKWKSIFGG